MSMEIPLTRGLVAIVDDEDFERLNQFKWHAIVPRRGGNAYAKRYERRPGEKARHIVMHAEILGLALGVMVDHINRNSLDNRRSNLRLCDASQNACNSIRPLGFSGRRGVHAHKSQTRPFRAEIISRGKRFTLGYFSTIDDAARAYDSAAIRLHGEFAVLNFPPIPADLKEDA